ncbi:MAG: hypothetical protein WB557_33720, partial [Solirubrobacteraceae bacterium]
MARVRPWEGEVFVSHDCRRSQRVLGGRWRRPAMLGFVGALLAALSTIALGAWTGAAAGAAPARL